jgi:hypothetical protein
MVTLVLPAICIFSCRKLTYAPEVLCCFSGDDRGSPTGLMQALVARVFFPADLGAARPGSAFLSVIASCLEERRTALNLSFTEKEGA